MIGGRHVSSNRMMDTRYATDLVSFLPGVTSGQPNFDITSRPILSLRLQSRREASAGWVGLGRWSRGPGGRRTAPHAPREQPLLDELFSLSISMAHMSRPFRHQFTSAARRGNYGHETRRIAASRIEGLPQHRNIFFSTATS